MTHYLYGRCLEFENRSGYHLEMARILHVITGLDTGGAEMMLLKLLSANVGRHDHAVVSLSDKGSIGEPLCEVGIPVYSLGLRAATPNPLRALSIRSLTRKLRPHLIQGWMYHGNLAASLAASSAQNRPPVIWSVHQTLYHQLAKERWMTSAVIRLGAWHSSRIAGIVYVSQISRKHHEALGYDSSRGLVIPNGIDCNTFVPDEEARCQVRSELGVPEGAVLVGLVARYHPMKDQAGFLRAAALVTQAHPSARFVLAGRGIDGQPDLLRLIAQLGIADRALLLKERQDVPRLTAAFDIACSSSAWGESFSNTVGEAMACGVPCVVTDVGDNANIVLETGCVIPPSSPDALAQAISQLIAAGSSGRRALGAKARERVQKEFSLPAVARRYEAVYQTYLGLHSSS